jgi:hypothetical protein
VYLINERLQKLIILAGKPQPCRQLRCAGDFFIQKTIDCTTPGPANDSGLVSPRRHGIKVNIPKSAIPGNSTVDVPSGCPNVHWTPLALDQCCTCHSLVNLPDLDDGLVRQHRKSNHQAQRQATSKTMF